MPLIDLSQPLHPQTPVYPGDPPVQIEILEVAAEPTAGERRRLNNSRISIGLHNGTHIDAPFHFFSELPTIDQVPLDHCCGPGICLDLTKTHRAGIIDADDLSGCPAVGNDLSVLMLYTGWSDHWGESAYFDRHPVLTAAAAEKIVASGMQLVGVDFPSVDQPPFPAHLVLLKNHVLIVENLRRLKQLVGRPFEFFGVPLPVEGRDASPIRAFARLS